uniref:Leucine-rich repeat LGI family, member 2b n=1 Tax=Nothobranchius kuhntae TaxID=321403 RepID=A0A1A8KBY7_NOTKU
MADCARWFKAGLALLCIIGAAESKRVVKCPSGCSCSKENIICVGTSQIPRTIPSESNSLSIVNGSIAEISEGMFALMPSLQLLLLNSNSLSTIKDDAFSGKSVVGCKSFLIDAHVFIIVTQLFGGSHIFKFNEQQNKFIKFQTVEVVNISKPNDMEVFQMDGDWYFLIVDSSKAGLSTLYKWADQPERNETGFYSYQFLHEWFRDTDAELVEVDGKLYLILASRSQSPVIYLWNKGTLTFVVHSEIQNVDDVVSVKAFQVESDLFLALACYIGDSKVVKWVNKQFTEILALPSRGAMILQPFAFSDRHYLALGSDYSFTQIYLWDNETKTFHKFKDVYVQSPRSFTVVTTDRRSFIFSSSLKGKSLVFEHIFVDLSL